MIPFWLAVGTVAALDQWTKHIIASTFFPGESRLFIPHLLYWTFVQNHRGAFGLFGTQTWLLVAMATAVLGVFWYSFRDLLPADAPEYASPSAASWGGAIGNIIDRFHYAYVVDFIDLRWWPVFNVADLGITLGVVLLIVSSLRGDGALKQTSAHSAE